MEDLSKKISQGVLWVALGRVVARLFNLVSSIILTGLLLPSDFGLMAIVSSVIYFAQGTTQTGMISALTQKQGNIEKYLDIAWTIEFIKNIILFIIIFFMAPLISMFFQESSAMPMLRTIATLFIITGLSNIRVVYFRKKLHLKKQFFIDTIPTLINIICTISLAIILKNVWALVAGIVIQKFCICIMSYIYYPSIPKIRLQKDHTWELINFGKWIFISSIVINIKKQGIIMFTAKLFSMNALGYYNRALVFSKYLVDEIIRIFWSVGFPAFSLIQNDINTIRLNYIKLLTLATFIGIPICGGIYIVSNDFVVLFLKEDWVSIIPLMQIFAFLGIFMFINAPAGIVLQAIGRPDIPSKIAIFDLLIVLIFFLPLTKYFGLEGVALSLLLSAIIVFPVTTYNILKITKVRFSLFFKPIIFSLSNTFVMISLIQLFNQFYFYDITINKLLLVILIGTLIYLINSLIFEIFFNYKGLKLVRERLYALKIVGKNEKI